MIAAGMNLVPELGRATYDAVAKGDLDHAAAVQQRLFTIVMTCRAGQPPAGWKAALAWAGVCSDALVPPAIPLSPDLQTALATTLTAMSERCAGDQSPFRA